MAKYNPDVVNAYDFYQKINLALKTNTTYAVGTFGSSLDIQRNLTRITKSGWNKEHKDQIYEDAAKGHCFAFDCIGFVKSIGWWGWDADPSRTYGSAVYKSAGMPDISVNGFFRDLCYEKHSISNVEPIPILSFCGVNDNSHIAISLGNNVVVEATRYGTHNVRLARIKGKPVPRCYQDLPERTFNFYALCKYVSFDGCWQLSDANGVTGIIKQIPELRAPVVITNITETK